MDCSLENDEGNFLLHVTGPHPGQSNKSANNNLDKPFGMDLSVEHGGQSNRSSVVSQVSFHDKISSLTSSACRVS